MKRLTREQVARWLWERDGKPDGHELGEANRGTYSREVIDVFAAIRAMGFKIVPQALGVDGGRPTASEADMPANPKEQAPIIAESSPS